MGKTGKDERPEPGCFARADDGLEVARHSACNDPRFWEVSQHPLAVSRFAIREESVLTLPEGPQPLSLRLQKAVRANPSPRLKEPAATSAITSTSLPLLLSGRGYPSVTAAIDSGGSEPIWSHNVD